MKGGVIRVALDGELGVRISDELVNALRMRGNVVERFNSDTLKSLGIEDRFDVGLKIAERFSKFGVWSVLEGIDVPLDPLLETVDVRIGDRSHGSVLDPRQANDVRYVFEVAARSSFMEPPLIILGRGGSGTRIISEACRAMGVFIGTRINESADSLEMMDVGYVLFHEHGTGKELPSGLPGAAEEVKVAATKMLARGNAPLGGSWGWKLPETMLILPLAMEAFPNAKVVHLVRHPCGISLNPDNHLTDRWEHHLGRQVLRGAASYMGLTEEEVKGESAWMQGAYSWTFQVKRVRDWCRHHLPPEQYMEIAVEDIARDPKAALKRVASFSGVRWVPWNPPIDPRRLRHWDSNSQEAKDVWKVAGEVAMSFGYRGP